MQKDTTNRPIRIPLPLGASLPGPTDDVVYVAVPGRLKAMTRREYERDRDLLESLGHDTTKEEK